MEEDSRPVTKDAGSAAMRQQRTLIFARSVERGFKEWRAMSKRIIKDVRFGYEENIRLW